ncbi:MAG: RNA methyltransferase [Polyangiaceae bacterium]|nr:RNA methyltransferase [Polyangiaceae bacterium]
MKREENDDVFEPEPIAVVTEVAKTSPRAMPGPTTAWSAEGVIAVLEELVVSERRERLQKALSARKRDVTVVMDHPHDPHNASAVLRSCDAFGVQEVHVLVDHEVFAASRMVAKGSQRWVDVVEYRDAQQLADQLHQENYQLLITHPEGELTLEDLPDLEKVALLMGNERDGICPELAAHADGKIRIPMCGFVESLNVSVSAAILVQAATSQRTGDLGDLEKQELYARWLRATVPRADEILLASEAR